MTIISVKISILKVGLATLLGEGGALEKSTLCTIKCESADKFLLAPIKTKDTNRPSHFNTKVLK